MDPSIEDTTGTAATLLPVSKDGGAAAPLTPAPALDAGTDGPDAGSRPTGTTAGSRPTGATASAAIEALPAGEFDE